MTRRTAPTAAQIAAAMRFYQASNPAPAGLSRTWLIHWPEIEPTVRRYQWHVTRDRVLAEHHGAVAATPLENEQ